MMQLFFPDKVVTYETFLDDLSARVASRLQGMAKDPEYVSTRQAYQMFGRANVERWRKQGRITPCKRPGKVEYLTAELRRQASTQQDYFG